MVQTMTIYFRQHLKSSMRRAVKELGIPSFTLKNILKEPGHTKSYKISIIHQNWTQDGTRQAAFSQLISDNMSYDSGFLHRIVFSSEMSLTSQNLGTLRALVVWAQETQTRFKPRKGQQKNNSVACCVRQRGVTSILF